MAIGETVRAMKNPSPISKPNTGFTFAEYEACAKEAKPLLKRLKTALGGTYLHPPTRSGLETHMISGSRFRDIARLLSGVATYHEMRKEYAKAAELLLDCMEMGVTLPKGGVLIQDLIGHACISIAGSNLENLLPILPPAELRTSINRLMAIRAKLVPYYEIVIEERSSSTAMHLEWMRQPQRLEEYLKSIQELLSWTQSTPAASAAWYAKVREVFDTFKFLLADKKAMLSDNQRCYDGIAKEASTPYRGKSKVRIPNNPFAIGCDLVANGGREAHVRKTADIDLLLVSAAVLLYYAEHGVGPDNLQQLIPTYTPTLPVDPFGGGQFGYKSKRGGKELSLYSIGPDLRDDGGKSVTRQARNGPGDIVAGNAYLVTRRYPKARTKP